MTTSGGSFPRHAALIDALTRGHHYYLQENDVCAFIGEYTAHAGYEHSQTNQIVFNLKKPMNRRGKSDWRYKAAAIAEAASALGSVLSKRALDTYTFVPIPPSRVRDDPDYDDRMVQVLREIRPSQRVDVRELIVQTTNTAPVHGSVTRMRPGAIAKLYQIDEELTSPQPEAFVVVDDVLTTGAHFKAAQSVLTKRFPTVPVRGLFIARRALEQNEE